MKKPTGTIVEQICVILLAVCLVTFFIGLSVMTAMREENLRVLYAQSVDLVSQPVAAVAAEVDRVRQIAYDIIVSDAVQAAASAYLDAEDGEKGLSVLNQHIVSIGNTVMQQIAESELVTCANFIDSRGSVRVFVSRGYRKLEDARAAEVERLGIEAEGATLLLPENADGSGLIVVKELREKRDLSMRHVGVLVLEVDLDAVSRLLEYDRAGAYLLEFDDRCAYALGTLPADLSLGDVKDAFSGNRGYALISSPSGSYFAAHVPVRDLDAYVIIPHGDLFSGSERTFRKYVVTFLAFSALATVLSFFLVHRVTRDYRRLVRHLSGISGREGDVIPPVPVEGRMSRDARELYEAFNAMAERVNRLVDDNYRKQLLITETQLSALQAQINPHFLYNTLNSIYWTAREQGNREVAAMTNSLSRLLREAVSISSMLIPMDRELEIVRNYVQIQRIRFKDRLRFTFDVSDDCSALAIPKFTLQVLLENAVSHGADKMLGTCRVEAVIRREGDLCVCRVANTGPAPEEHLLEKLRSGEKRREGSGIGLMNVEKRIKALLGENSALEITRDEESEKTVVTLTFPAKPLEGGEGGGGDG